MICMMDTQHASSYHTNIHASGPLLPPGMLNVTTGTHSGSRTSSTEEALTSNLRVTVMNLNVVFVCLSFYLAMILTNWGTISAHDDSNTPTGGTVSMWMQAVGGWIAVALYMLGLVLPKFKFLPRSVWDLQPKF